MEMDDFKHKDKVKVATIRKEPIKDSHDHANLPVILLLVNRSCKLVK